MEPSLPKRCLILLPLAALLVACPAMQRAPTFQAPETGPQAQLTYTATNLKEGFLGISNGVSSIMFYSTPKFCIPLRNRLGDIQQVSVEQPEVTVTIPADQPLILEVYWQGADQGCLLGNRVFVAEPGVHYRMALEVNLKTNRCTLRVHRQADDGSRTLLGQLQTMDQICMAGKPIPGTQ